MVKRQKKLFFKKNFKIDFIFSTLFKIVLSIGISLIFPIKLLAQEGSTSVLEMEMAEPNEHEQRVYVNEEKIIFWPQDKPVFFWLWTSSDENAELFPLLHSGTMNKSGHWRSHSKDEVEKYRQEGLKLEISSNQFDVSYQSENNKFFISSINDISYDNETYKFKLIS